MSNAHKTIKSSASGNASAMKRTRFSLDPSGSAEEMNPKSNHELNSTVSCPQASEPQGGTNTINSAGREYTCKYCHKKFFNKQAFGGHQNAHKIERFVERSAQEVRKTNFGYVWDSSYPGMTSPPFPGAFNSTPEVFNQSMVNGPYCPQFMPHPMHPGNYSQLPTTQAPFAPQRLQVLNLGYPGWQDRTLTNSQFVSSPPRTEYQTIGMWNSTFTTTHSNLGAILGTSDDLPNAGFPQSMHNINAGFQANAQLNDLENQQQDSGLDLSLQL